MAAPKGNQYASKLPTAPKDRKALFEAIEQVAEDGGTLLEMAHEAGIDRHTLNAWMERDEEVSTIVKRAVEKSQVWWERNGRMLSKMGGGNATAHIFHMKNRFPEDYRDKQDVELSGTVKTQALPWDGMYQDQEEDADT